MIIEPYLDYIPIILFPHFGNFIIKEKFYFNRKIDFIKNKVANESCLKKKKKEQPKESDRECGLTPLNK